MRKVLLFSSVSDINDFYKQGFYIEDIAIWKSLGYDVICTNNFFDFIFKDYQVAFLYFYKWSLIPAFFSRVRQKKVYFTGGIDDLSDHMQISFLKRVIFRLLFLINFLFATRINIVSDSDYLNISRLLSLFTSSFKQNKIHCFPHSVNLDIVVRSNFFCKEPHTFATVCWMSTKGNVIRKGLDKSLEFFYYYSLRHRESKFFIIGKIGEGTDYLKTLSFFRAIEDKVIFTDFISDERKFELLQLSTYYMQFSKYEGFGIAALEANLCKCYVIHSGKGGYLESDDIWGLKFVESSIKKREEIYAAIDFVTLLKENNNLNSKVEFLRMKYSRQTRMINLRKLINDGGI